MINGGLYSMPIVGPDAFLISINGEPVASPTIVRGYAVLRREWCAGDKLDIRMRRSVQLVKADDRVDSDRGRAALMRGPIVYCLESHDNQGRVRDVWLPVGASVTSDWRSDLLGGVDHPPRRGPTAAAGRWKAVQNRSRGDPLLRERQSRPCRDDCLGADDPGLCDADDRVTFHSDSLSLLRQRHRGCDERWRRTQEFVDVLCRRFSWWDRRGTDEWVQYDFGQPRQVGGHERLLVGRQSTWTPLRRTDELAAALPQAGRQMGACPGAQ